MTRIVPTAIRARPRARRKEDLEAQPAQGIISAGVARLISPTQRSTLMLRTNTRAFSHKEASQREKLPKMKRKILGRFLIRTLRTSKISS